MFVLNRVRQTSNFQLVNDSHVVTSHTKVIGNGNTITGDHNIILGNRNKSTGNNNSICGNNNRINGDKNQITGNNNNIRGNENTMIGMNNKSRGKMNGDVKTSKISHQKHQQQTESRQVQSIVSGFLRSERLLNNKRIVKKIPRSHKHRKSQKPKFSIPEPVDRSSEIVKKIFDKNGNSNINYEFMCVACTEAKKCVLFMDCEHVDLCVTCARTILKTTKKCPRCRKRQRKGGKKIYI